MVDIDKINYTITGFDEVNMVIFVDFKGEGNANIALRGSIPKTQDELDTLVRTFAPHKEMVQTAKASSASDFEFVRGRIGKSRSTERFSAGAPLTNASSEPSNDFVLAFEKAQVQQGLADREYIIGLIKEVLAEQK